MLLRSATDSEPHCRLTELHSADDNAVKLAMRTGGESAQPVQNVQKISIIKRYRMHQLSFNSHWTHDHRWRNCVKTRRTWRVTADRCDSQQWTKPAEPVTVCRLQAHQSEEHVHRACAGYERVWPADRRRRQTTQDQRCWSARRLPAVAASELWCVLVDQP